MWNEDGITQSRHCKFESSFLKCFLKMGSESQIENLQFSLQAEAFCGGGFEALPAAIPRWLKKVNKSEAFCFCFFCFVCSQAAASGGGARSGVHQRCQCQSLPGHEGGRQIAGLGKQHLPDVSVAVSCPCSVWGGLSSCRTYSAVGAGFIRRNELCPAPVSYLK